MTTEENKELLLRDHNHRRSLTELSERIGKWAESKGFRYDWNRAEDENRPDVAAMVVSQKLMLISDELSEAHETLRKHGVQGGPTFDLDDSKDFNFGEELADVIIRVLDLAHMGHINIGRRITDKLAVNDGRPHMHGKQF